MVCRAYDPAVTPGRSDLRRYTPTSDLIKQRSMMARFEDMCDGCTHPAITLFEAGNVLGVSQ